MWEGGYWVLGGGVGGQNKNKRTFAVAHRLTTLFILAVSPSWHWSQLSWSNKGVKARLILSVDKSA